MKYIFAALFLACIPVANFLIQNVGTVCVPNGPCLIPVFPGVMAPSGVLVIGAALALRDAVQEHFGKVVVFGLICIGSLLSAFFSPWTLALASAAAFFISEVLDFFTYSNIRRYSQPIAVIASGLVGAAVDSVLFSWIAFGTVKWSVGLIVAKMYASILFAAWVTFRNRKGAV
jgi:hypothetical protein